MFLIFALCCIYFKRANNFSGAEGLGEQQAEEEADVPGTSERAGAKRILLGEHGGQGRFGRFRGRRSGTR